jgi:predicted DNA-binding antitoxin AbrB/MazE fold protein
MTRVLAIYEKGVFRPTQPVQIIDGAEVELTIDSTPVRADSSNIVAALEEVARMPLEGPNDGFSGANHDEILYGE